VSIEGKRAKERGPKEILKKKMKKKNAFVKAELHTIHKFKDKSILHF
jgi:hypothetical protein